MLAEGHARKTLAGRATHADQAILRGVSAPIGVVRVRPPP